MPERTMSPDVSAAYEWWRSAIHGSLSSLAPENERTPATIQENVLKRSGYIGHFPQNVMRANSLQGDSQTLYMTPATCLHVYEGIADTSLVRNVVHLIEGDCMRYEGGVWEHPYRLPAFTMIELVAIGSPEHIETILSKVEFAIEALFSSANLPVVVIPATDAFFLGNDDGAKVMQKLKGLKNEYVIRLGDKEISLASRNLHEDYFGKAFNIRSGNAVAHSLCAAFGLQRLAYASVALWGSDRSKWPHDPL